MSWVFHIALLTSGILATIATSLDLASDQRIFHSDRLTTQSAHHLDSASVPQRCSQPEFLCQLFVF